MPYDGLVLAAITRELQEKLTGGRIDRIHQPTKDEVILVVRRPGFRGRLLLSANARSARVHLTRTTRENPAAAPVFCMVLRKHLEGGRIISMRQPGLERVLVIRVESRDELGRQSYKQLICEIMGKHSNILLVEPVTNVIIDGIKRYTHAVSRHREVLPGQPYLPPPFQNKLNPLLLNEEEFRQHCLDVPLETTLLELLQGGFEGLSKVTCREIIDRANLTPDVLLDHCGEYELRSLWEPFHQIMALTRNGRFVPCLTCGKKSKAMDFAALELTHTGLAIKHGEMNDLVDQFFYEREQAEVINKERNHVIAVLKKEMSRLEKKLDLYRASLKATAEANKFKLYGELLTANLYRLKQGQPEACLENYYESREQIVTIPLERHRSPSENAQRYFKKYIKARNTRTALEPRIADAREEMLYLEGVKTDLEQAGSLPELAEIKQELAEQGYLKSPPPSPGGKKKKKERLLPKPLSFVSSDGMQILVGKNNKQNDYLTLKLARENDLWLHTKDIHGSHVIIRTEGKEISASTLTEAAALAAFFSKGRSSTNVPVDYTLKKHVSKPKGARPGMVIYRQQRTIIAMPDEKLVEELGDRSREEGKIKG
ncbi:MAG: NFACT RNA binding domain-containing protein [Desulfotomaculaceae bacterium]|nr:NFACT RNA binding domain-containing protein [Desulfotomaculaceae bacterium]